MQNFVKRLQLQKEDALEYVIDEYMPLVKAIAMNVLQPLGQRDTVDECVNDVFLSIWQNAHQFEGETADFKKWVGMIAKYKAIDLYRKFDKKLSRETELNGTIQNADPMNSQEHYLKQERRNELLFELSKLDELDRDIFVMKYFLELTTNEISNATQLSKQAVENRLYRGKKKLAKIIQLKELFV